MVPQETLSNFYILFEEQCFSRQTEKSYLRAQLENYHETLVQFNTGI